MEKADAQDFFAHNIAKLKSEDVPLVEDDDKVDDAYEGNAHAEKTVREVFGQDDFIQTITEMSECGVFSLSGFREYFRTHFDQERAFGELRAAVDCFKRSVEEIRKVERASNYAGMGMGLDEESGFLKIVSGVEERLGEIWSERPCLPAGRPEFVDEQCVDLLMRRYFRVDRYTYLHMVLNSLRGRLLGEVSEGIPEEHREEGENVKRTNVVSLRIVSSAMVLRAQIGEDLNLVKALPANDERHEGSVSGAGRFVTSNPAYVARQLVAKLTDVLPSLREQLLEVRRDTFGLLPVGGKIHVLHDVDMKRFTSFRDLMGLDHTVFRLDRANTSVILSPVPSAKELQLMAAALDAFGVIDKNLPELQLSLPGRLTPKDAAVLGSAILLATEKGKEYDENAFLTNQNESTGKRIMSYEGHGYCRVQLPFMTPLSGRTDMLGRRSLSDADLYQLLGTVLIQAEAKSGPFAKFAHEFKFRYLQILARHELESVLEGSWIFRPGVDVLDDDHANRNHYDTVKKCTDAYFSCADEYRRILEETGEAREEGIIFEVRRLFDWLREKVREVQEEIYFDVAGGVKPCAEAKILLQF